MCAPSLTTLHGFRVNPCGRSLSRGFAKALRRLSERGFADPSCVVVKTSTSPHSGVTHAGGRYVHGRNPYAKEVTRAMRDQGLEPPPPPFVVAPGAFTLYHEWGHHVDRTWSRDDQEVLFSFRWFSRFYEIGTQRFRRPEQAAHEPHEAIVPVESELRAGDAALAWSQVSSELFADLFEDWMRAEQRVPWDHCEPESLNSFYLGAHPDLRMALLPGTRPQDVRDETHGLFGSGIRSRIVPPPVRADLFGAYTARVLDRFREAMKNVRREREPVRGGDAT